MSQAKIKVIWGASKVISARWKLGLFGFYDRVSGKGRTTGLVISIRGALIWSACLAVAAYFAGSGVYFLWLDRKPVNFVTYADVVTSPWNWERFRALRGQAQIEEGLEDFKKQNWSDGSMKLRVGLARAPRSVKGRLELAQFFLVLNARKQAIEILDGGLAYDYPGRNYVDTVCRIAATAEDYDYWLRTTDRALELLANRPRLAADRKYFVQQRLSALLAADRAEEAVKFAEKEGELDSSMLSEFKLLALLKDNKPDEAVAFAERWKARIGANPQIVRLQARAFREAKRFPEMDRALAELRALTPGDAAPYVFTVIQLLLAERTTEAAAALETFFFRFGSTKENLQLLATPLAEIGDAETLLEVIARAREQGLPLRALKQSLLQAYMTKDNWQKAKALAVEIRREAPPADDTEKFWLDLVETSASAALDPSSGPQESLIGLVREKQLPFRFYREIITSMRAAGRPETARELVTFAEGVYPENALLRRWRGELDAEVGKIRAARAADEREAANVGTAAGADTVFIRQLEAAIQAADYETALRQIRDVRRANPPWLAKRDSEIMLLEISANGRAGNLLELGAAVRVYANGDRNRSARVYALAKEIYESGRKAEGVMAMKELLRRVPDYPPALRTMDEWEPKPKPASKTAGESANGTTPAGPVEGKQP